ncbi:MAG: LysR family transcriptional regulator [Lachnospiraceae bacterium]|jgi:DNA-binding transcriptional LysR family regulator|nr:LysR family transcriptional regulator [Lachnospiraceae bacterium]
MDLYQLKVFALAAEYQSFSKVADVLFISAPSISKYIAQLEAEVSQKLFVRDGRRVWLTEFGKTYLNYVNEILAAEERANSYRSTLKSDADIRYIGIVSHMEVAPADFYTDILSAKMDFEKGRPDVEVKAVFHGFEDLRLNFNKGGIDVALVSIKNTEVPATLPDGMKWRKLKHFSYSLAMCGKNVHLGTLEEALGQIKALAFVDMPAPKRLARAFIDKYHVAAQLIPVGHWGEGLLRMASGECATFLTKNLEPTALVCGTRLFTLPDREFSNGLYALWREENAKTHIPELVGCLGRRFAAQGG